VLRLIDETQFLPISDYAGWDCAVTLDRLLAVGSRWCAGVQPKPRQLDYWALDQWLPPWSAGPLETLEGLDLLRASCAAALTDSTGSAIAGLKRFLATCDPERFEWEKAQMVLVWMALVRGDRDEVTRRLATVVRQTRGLAAPLREPATAAAIVETGALSGIWGLTAEELDAVADEIVRIAHVRARGLATATGTPIQVDWHAIVQRLESNGRRGRPSASEADIAAAERRLGRILPPSFRAFLRTSNGYTLASDAFLEVELPIEIFAVADVVRLAESEPDLVEVWANDSYVDEEEHRRYGVEQPEGFYGPYLREALQISTADETGVWLLNPAVQTPDGEWEAWELYHTGAHRYRSFAEHMATAVENLDST
jgi:hypothetical protein